MECKFTEQDMVLFYYKEMPEPELAKIETHLRECESCWQRYCHLKDMLDAMVVPEEGLSEQQWAQLKARITERIEHPGKAAMFLRPAFALIVLLVVFLGVYMGYKRFSQQDQERFISEHYELLMNLDFYEDLDVIEQMEALADA